MAPTTFGKYVVTELLGSGGMAEVYAGIHPDLGRKVAIKVILPQFATEQNFEERFRREARLVASLRHAHIVQLFDFDVVDGRHFMVMEYLDGGTLKEALRTRHRQQERMALPEIADLLDALAGALDYAHSRGAIHRDIKPANILFTAERVPVLTDFGIAKLLEDAAHLTATGGVVGSPFYMSPEQATGGSVDARSDQYSLGVVLYEMAAGRVPFQGGSAVAVMTQHLNNPPPAPRTLNAALPAAVEAVLLKVLAKQPEARFGSCGELALAFRRALNGPGERSGSPQVGDDKAATVLDEPTTGSGTPGGVNAADAATVVDDGAQASAQDGATDASKDTDPAAGLPSAPPSASSESEQAELPPVKREEPLDRAAPATPQTARDADEPPATNPPPPQSTTQNFNVGGIQAGIVNQGGEQTFNGELTFNLDFGESKPAPQKDAQSQRTPASRELQDLAVMLDALRRAFAGSARVDRFVRLVTQFHEQLEALPPERAIDRNQVVKRVQALLLEMTEADPDPDLVEIMATSLERSVQPLATVDPDLPTLVTRITSWSESLVQPE